MKINELKNEILNILKIEALKNHSDAFANGLQINGLDKNQKIKKIAFGVTASLELFKKAKSENCDVIITHHGLNFFGIKNSIPDKILHDRIKFLFQNKMALFGFHFLLDSHPVFGNNIQIIKKISQNIKNKKLEKLKKFGNHKNDFWGYSCEFPNKISIKKIYDISNKIFLDNSKILNFGKKEIKKVAVNSGAGHFAIQEAYQKNIDLLITGEISEHTQETCRELKINLIWGGHYISERLGLISLKNSDFFKENFQTTFIEIMNET